MNRSRNTFSKHNMLLDLAINPTVTETLEDIIQMSIGEGRLGGAGCAVTTMLYKRQRYR